MLAWAVYEARTYGSVRGMRRQRLTLLDIGAPLSRRCLWGWAIGIGRIKGDQAGATDNSQKTLRHFLRDNPVLLAFDQRALIDADSTTPQAAK